MTPLNVYHQLLNAYGHQNWWPVQGGSLRRPGYDPKFEIVIGAILTQNTAWINVERAISNLYDHDLLEPRRLYRARSNTLKKLIRPAGYFNQKEKKLRIFTKHLLDKFEGDTSKLFRSRRTHKIRSELLSLWGIGKETADSILLYAGGRATFVVDAYTRRLVARRSWPIDPKTEYDEIRSFFESSLPKSPKLFNEYHALIVAWGKDKNSNAH